MEEEFCRCKQERNSGLAAVVVVDTAAELAVAAADTVAVLAVAELVVAAADTVERVPVAETVAELAVVLVADTTEGLAGSFAVGMKKRPAGLGERHKNLVQKMTQNHPQKGH